VLWRGGLANRPDVCLIWRRRGRHSEDWTTPEDEYIRENYPTGDKLRMLEALPLRSWNMIFYRALTLHVRRRVDTPNVIPPNVTMQDLNVIPDRATALMVVAEACTSNHTSYGMWLYSANLREFAREVDHRDGKNSEWAGSSLSC